MIRSTWNFWTNSTIFVQTTKYSISFAMKLLRLFFISVQNVKNTRKLMEVKIPNRTEIGNAETTSVCVRKEEEKVLTERARERERGGNDLGHAIPKKEV